MKYLHVLRVACLLLPVQSMAQPVWPTPKKMDVRSERCFTFANPANETSILLDSALALPSEEAYVLDISKKGIAIRARSQRGVIWAYQSLRQLEQPASAGRCYPDVHIEDYPAFPFRGFMLDNGRNFMETAMIKQYLDILSLYKINVFHWHLTDHPAWRIECKAYPQLNDPQYHLKGRDEGRFYSYDEIRDVIAYAAKRGITVVPEIDMPGHSAYFERTFGFRMESPQGRRVLEICLDEFFREVPAADCPWFHMGSDEVHIEDPQGFMQFIEGIVRRNGRRPIAWDPGLQGSPAVVRQMWRDRGLSRDEKMDSTQACIDSFMGYLNYYDPMLFTSRMLLHDPTVAGPACLGGILCLWNDVNVRDKQKVADHNGFYNGLLPFAEKFWTAEQPAFDGDPSVLPSPGSPAGQYLQRMEQRMADQRDRVLADYPVRWVANAGIPWMLTDPLEAGGDTVGVRWSPVWGGAVDLDVFAQQRGVQAEAGMEIYARTVLYCRNDTVVDAWVGFEVPARSNRLSCGIGRQGEWESGGAVWVNGALLSPPAWKEAGAYNFPYNTWARPEELLPYTDEQLYWMRSTVRISLQKGRNEIVLRARKTFAGQRWSFAFIPLSRDENGKAVEAKNIRY